MDGLFRGFLLEREAVVGVVSHFPPSFSFSPLQK